jgi:hypothetical protein
MSPISLEAHIIELVAKQVNPDAQARYLQRIRLGAAAGPARHRDDHRRSRLDHRASGFRW